MGLPDVKQSATEARLAAMTLPEGGCLKAARQAALSTADEFNFVCHE